MLLLRDVLLGSLESETHAVMQLDSEAVFFDAPENSAERLVKVHRNKSVVFTPGPPRGLHVRGLFLS